MYGIFKPTVPYIWLKFMENIWKCMKMYVNIPYMDPMSNGLL